MTNWGILGTGNIAKTFASAIKGTERSKLIAVGSRSKESADLLYHLSVLWISVDVKPDDVWNELQNRRGKSGLDEKKSRLS